MTNRIPRGISPPPGRSRALTLLETLLILAAGPAAAADFSLTAGIGAEYDTNAFELASIEGPPIVEGVADDRDDIARTLTLNGSAQLGGEGPTQLQIDAMFTRSESGSYDGLDRNDYVFGGVFDWKLTRAIDFSLEASQNRLPLGLADVGGDEATQQESTQAQATLDVRPTPRWQIGLSPGWRKDTTVLTGAPEFELTEKIGTASLDYLGAGRVVPGISVTGTRGEYEGIEDATRYRQRTIEGTLEYEATGLSSFSLALGHTRRTTRLVGPPVSPDASAVEGSDSALTGALNYHRALSVKTSVDISAFRFFQQYDAGVNTTVGTGFNVSINWAPTAKIGVNLGTAVIFADIEDIAAAGADRTRRDLGRGYNFALTYQATRSVGLRTYVSRRIRRSEVWVDQFNSTQAGLELTVRVD